MVLEGFCARLAAQRVTVDQLLEMGKVVGRLEAASAGDDELLPDTLQRLHAPCLRLGTVRCAMDQQKDITDALGAGDAE